MVSAVQTSIIAVQVFTGQLLGVGAVVQLRPLHPVVLTHVVYDGLVNPDVTAAVYDDQHQSSVFLTTPPGHSAAVGLHFLSTQYDASLQPVFVALQPNKQVRT